MNYAASDIRCHKSGIVFGVCIIVMPIQFGFILSNLILIVIILYVSAT